MTGNAGLVNLETEEEKQEANEPKQRSGEEDCEEDDLFEINLEAVSDAKSSRRYECQRFPARTGSVLLANCLLPAADISGAVPATSRAWNDLVWFRRLLYVENLGTDRDYTETPNPDAKPTHLHNPDAKQTPCLPNSVKHCYLDLNGQSKLKHIS
ncbi:unnamed protein product [Brassica oleracea]